MRCTKSCVPLVWILVDMLAGVDGAREVDAEVICGDVPMVDTVAQLRGELLATSLPALATALHRPEVAHDLEDLGLNVDVFALLRGDPAAAQAVTMIVERLKNRARVRRLVRVASAAAPRLCTVMLHARDARLASTLRQSPACDGASVCVVGLAHMDGIARRYLDPKWTCDEKLPPLPAAPHVRLGDVPALEALASELASGIAKQDPRATEKLLSMLAGKSPLR